MPYPNEHACRLQDPSKYDEFRRTTGGKVGKVTVPKTISVIWGHPKGAPDGTFVPQALRFPTKSYTADEAKAWMKDNEVKGSFEAAAEEESLKPTTEELFNSLSQQLDAAVTKRFGDSYWMYDFSKDSILMKKKATPTSSLQPVAVDAPSDQFFQVKWKFNKGEVEFDGNPVEVRRVVTFV
jgi:hypothetical protein